MKLMKSQSASYAKCTYNMKGWQQYIVVEIDVIEASCLFVFSNGSQQLKCEIYEKCFNWRGYCSRLVRKILKVGLYVWCSIS